MTFAMFAATDAIGFLQCTNGILFAKVRVSEEVITI